MNGIDLNKVSKVYTTTHKSISGSLHVVKYDGSSTKRALQSTDRICCAGLGCPKKIPLCTLIVIIDDGVVCCYACWKKYVNSFVHERAFYVKNLGVIPEDISKYISSFLRFLPTEEFSFISMDFNGKLTLQNHEFEKDIQLIYSDLVQSRFYSLPFLTSPRHKGDAIASYSWTKSVGGHVVHLIYISKGVVRIHETDTKSDNYYTSIVDALSHLKRFIE
jgi:hypothetical protein